jgi:methyl-accepting chemotaxis protein
MVEAEAMQVEKKAQFLAKSQELTQEVKQMTEAVNADVATGRQRVDDTQDSSFYTSLVSKAGFFLLTVGVLFWVLNTLLTKPVQAMTAAMGNLARGDLNVQIPAVGREDEIGQMASAVQVFKENAISANHLETEHAEIQKRTEREKALEMKKLADSFESSVGVVVKTVTEAASGMESSAENLATAAKQTSSRAETVSSAAIQASNNVSTVASAAEELSSSISEISRQVSQSTRIAGAAVAEVQGANEKVQGLADAAKKIGEVVALITDIADQTNLLALNATIEAARAGDAGKGFAVVASEVKNLANQTARATEEISAQIGGIQTATEDAVQAIGSIGGTIGKMNEIASAIAAAVEEQGAATQEIARNVEQAAAGTQDVSSNIVQVTQAATETGHSAGEVLVAAGELSKQSEVLGSEMKDFIVEMRKVI